MEFIQFESYYHLYFEGNEMTNRITMNVPNLFPGSTFTHYVGYDIEQFTNISRKHQCICKKSISTKDCLSIVGLVFMKALHIRKP